eukprot:scaffold95681_cov31-Tisochrysis_lutea.AAC.3
MDSSSRTLGRCHSFSPLLSSATATVLLCPLSQENLLVIRDMCVVCFLCNGPWRSRAARSWELLAVPMALVCRSSFVSLTPCSVRFPGLIQNSIRLTLAREERGEPKLKASHSASLAAGRCGVTELRSGSRPTPSVEVNVNARRSSRQRSIEHRE